MLQQSDGKSYILLFIEQLWVKINKKFKIIKVNTLGAKEMLKINNCPHPI